jgi:hypothetical protein
VVELNSFNQIHKLTKLITHITFSKKIVGLFYIGLAPYTGHAPLGFMSALETYPSLIGGGTTSTLT